MIRSGKIRIRKCKRKYETIRWMRGTHPRCTTGARRVGVKETGTNACNNIFRAYEKRDQGFYAERGERTKVLPEV